MLIKRVEKEKTIDCLYESSNILASSYDKTTRDLTITFNRGTQYIYRGVNNRDYLRLELADSQGAVLNTNIKSYAFVKGKDVDTAALINEIKLYETKVLPEADKAFIDTVRKILTISEGNKTVTTEDIDAISIAITKFITNPKDKEYEIN
jgi:hypothetical protein